MDDTEIQQMLLTAAANRTPPVRGVMPLGPPRQSASKPVEIKCDDGQNYFVKGQQAGRALVNDHIVGSLGKVIDAPVPDVRLVVLSDDLVKNNPVLTHMPADISHGSLRIPGATEFRQAMYQDEAVNRPRFASLAILYGWMSASDHQLLFKDEYPHLVYSHDHGHFFNGPEWTIDSLQALGRAEIDPWMSKEFNLTKEELVEAGKMLANVSPPTIVQAVATPPNSWRISMEERVAMVRYLQRRLEEIKQAARAL